MTYGVVHNQLQWFIVVVMWKRKEQGNEEERKWVMCCGIFFFANFVCQFHQCGVLHSGNRNFFLFFFCYRHQEKKNRRVEGPELPGRFFPTVVNFCSTIPMWHGLLLKCQMLMYCRSWGATWNMSHAVLFLWLKLYIFFFEFVPMVWPLVCWLICATSSVTCEPVCMACLSVMCRDVCNLQFFF